MRFVHIADMHFDMQFKMLSDKIGIGEQRRYDQRVILRKIINYIKENNIKYFFIAGDLYENQYIRTSTIEYINKLFLEIDDTQIFIAPGNHDPLLKNSYYNNFLWNKNVHIFGPKFERIETDNIDIYGYGFDDFYCSNLNFNDLKISNPNKINILVIHGTLDGANLEDMQYNSMSTRMLQEKGFDYVALGHIHKNNFKNDGKIIYPGSTIAMGFDELGEHGMVTGEISKLGNKLEFIKLDELEFKADFLKKPVSSYSKGMRQRASMARALITNPRLLFLDEPTSGLDPSGAVLFRRIIEEERRKGTTVFLTTHNMLDADLLCDRVAFLSNGNIMALDTPKSLKEQNSNHRVMINYLYRGRREEQTIEASELEAGIPFAHDEIISAHSQEPTLEDMFIKYTGRGLS